ncbi:MAG: DUF4296 domain-containing protein [Flavobacteriales bacterium]|nr:DUF4296 domain-containing protein [Flavobacteriales bacterium]
MVSCEEEGIPENVLKKEAFVPVFTDVQILEATYKQRIVQTTNKDSLMSLGYAHIFQKHNIDKETFERSFTWWTEQPEAMAEVYDEVEARILEMESDLRNEINEN